MTNKNSFSISLFQNQTQKKEKLFYVCDVRCKKNKKIWKVESLLKFIFWSKNKLEQLKYGNDFNSTLKNNQFRKRKKPNTTLSHTQGECGFKISSENELHPMHLQDQKVRLQLEI